MTIKSMLFILSGMILLGACIDLAGYNDKQAAIKFIVAGLLVILATIWSI